jgi:hypothetical protein
MTLALAFLSNFQGTMVFLSLIQGDYFCMVSKVFKSHRLKLFPTPKISGNEPNLAVGNFMLAIY